MAEVLAPPISYIDVLSMNIEGPKVIIIEDHESQLALFNRVLQGVDTTGTSVYALVPNDTDKNVNPATGGIQSMILPDTDDDLEAFAIGAGQWRESVTYVVDLNLGDTYGYPLGIQGQFEGGLGLDFARRIIDQNPAARICFCTSAYDQYSLHGDLAAAGFIHADKATGDDNGLVPVEVYNKDVPSFLQILGVER